MPYHEVKDPFQTAQDVLFEQLRKAGAEKQRREREQEHYQSMQDYLSEQVNNYNNGVDPADEEPGYGTEKTNQDVQDSMNEKLADKGIKVDNVDTKHVSDETQDMILANRPTTAGQTDKKFSVSTQPKPTDSPLGDMETMGKMKTNTSTSTGMTPSTPDTPSYGTEKTNQDVQDSMNEKLADKGIKVDNVDTKHVSDETQDMILANRPTTAGQTDKKFSVSTQPKPTETTGEKNESIQTSMNEKLGDKGIKVGGVNSGAVEGKEVNPVKNVNPPKTIQKRFKDDSGYVTRIVPNKPSATVAQGSETKVKAPSKTPDK